MICGMTGCSESSSCMMIADACVVAIFSRYLGLFKNVMSPSQASSNVLQPVMIRSLSPRISLAKPCSDKYLERSPSVSVCTVQSHSNKSIRFL